MASSKKVDVYLEIGKKRIFASALEWPGWCRSGRDEEAALQALVDAGPRFSRVIHTAKLKFQPPADPSKLAVVERLPGTTTTDFGAPDATPDADRQPVDDAELRRLQSILRASWRALDKAAKSAEGRELHKGPRGGGRELDEIIRHVMGAEQGYLGRLTAKWRSQPGEELAEERDRTRKAVLDALAAAVNDGLPKRGPRGGVIWTPRYFVRRVAWHALDHTWEIEDRAGQASDKG